MKKRGGGGGRGLRLVVAGGSPEKCFRDAGGTGTRPWHKGQKDPFPGQEKRIPPPGKPPKKKEGIPNS